MFSLDSLHQTIIRIKKKITLNYPKYVNFCSYGMFFSVLKDEFEIAMVNEPSVVEPLKFYCILNFFIHP